MIIILLLLGLAMVNTISASTEWRDYGCYEPKDSHYALHHSTFESDVMTTQSCANKCEASKYKLFGLDDGGHCLCDHSMEKAQKTSDNKCDAQCQSDPSQKCGTGDAIRVLKILDESDAVFKWSGWSTWGSCSNTCGPNGKKKRSLNCVKSIGKKKWPANANKCKGRSQLDFQSCNTHISCGCPPGTKVKVVSQKTCSCTPSSETLGLGSLIFVIDISASMDYAIQAVKDHIRSILAANKRFKNYIIGTFSDPYVKHLKKSTNVNEVKQFLDGLSAEGGEDCPEFAMTGALDVANIADYNSVMMLFTDASAKDQHLSNSLVQKLKEKRIRYYAVLSGKLCGHDSAQFDALAKVSHGQVANINTGAFDKLMEYIKRAVSGAVSFSAFPTNSAALDGVLRGKCACRSVNRRTCEKTTQGLAHPRPHPVKKPSPTVKIWLADCSQSSTILGGTCHKAIDGNTNQHWNAGSCTHTSKEVGWWKATSSQRMHIKEVKIFNRGDCCAERLNNFVILVDGQQCASYHSGTAFSIKSFKCEKIGREVMIKNQMNTDLTLCEVQVFGSAL